MEYENKKVRDLSPEEREHLFRALRQEKWPRPPVEELFVEVTVTFDVGWCIDDFIGEDEIEDPDDSIYNYWPEAEDLISGSIEMVQDAIRGHPETAASMARTYRASIREYVYARPD